MNDIKGFFKNPYTIVIISLILGFILICVIDIMDGISYNEKKYIRQGKAAIEYYFSSRHPNPNSIQIIKEEYDYENKEIGIYWCIEYTELGEDDKRHDGCLRCQTIGKAFKVDNDNCKLHIRGGRVSFRPLTIREYIYYILHKREIDEINRKMHEQENL